MASNTNGEANAHNTPSTGNPAAADVPQQTAVAQRQAFQNLQFNANMDHTSIDNFLTRYEDLEQQNATLKQENLSLKQRAAGLEFFGNHLQFILNRAPSILILLDGLPFKASLVLGGEAGGRRAATLLYDAIEQWALANIIELPDDFKVAARIYFDLTAFVQRGQGDAAGPSAAQVREFARGFMSVHALFDIVDVGAGKDLPVAKVAEVLKLSFLDYHCRQVLLGCTQDNEYVKQVTRYAEGDEAEKRLTLLEGGAFKADNSGVILQTIKLAEIFQETSIGVGQVKKSDDRTDSRGPDPRAGVFVPRSATPCTIGSPPDSLPVLAVQPLTVRSALHGRSDSIASSAMSSDFGTSTTWAGITAKNAHRPLQDLPRPTPAAIPVIPGVLRNKYGQRVDMPMDYDRDEVQRIKKLKSCNQYYIGDGCCHYKAGRTDKCPHSHEYKLSPTDLKWLRVVARETPCKRGHDCDETKCIYGHSCPFSFEGKSSAGCVNGDNCRFPHSMHRMDLEPAKK